MQNTGTTGEVGDSQDKEAFADENTKIELPSEHSLLGSHCTLCSKSPVGELKLQMAQDWKWANTAKRRMQVHVFVKKTQNHHYTTNNPAYFLKWGQWRSVLYWHTGIESKFINYWKLSFAMSFKFVKLIFEQIQAQ